MSHPLERLLAGRTLATRYRIVEPLGQGGMSVVFRAHDARLDREVAVKVLFLPDDREDGTSRERFRREAAAAARIPPHPNVVQIYDFGTDEDTGFDFIVMELFRGRDLGAVLRGGGVAPDRGRTILRDAARGVAAGHRAGIVHRDVKPGNIFLVSGPEGDVVKILDFGIAKAFDTGTDEDLTVAAVGPHSPSFASPEQLRGSEAVTPASDVYQLGLVGYELLAGERPFPGTAVQRLGEMESGSLPRRGRWDALDADLRDVVSRALDPDPAGRFPDAESLATELSRIAPVEDPGGEDHTLDAGDRTALAPPPAREGGTAPARPSGPPRPALRWPHRTIVRGAAVALGLLVIALVVWWPGAGDPGEPPEASVLPEEERTVFHILAVDAAERWMDRNGEMDEEVERAAVIRTIEDAHEAWMLGEMGRYAAHYAETVDFYDTAGFSRWALRQEREAARAEFPDSRVDISAVEVAFPGEHVAEVELIRDWRNPDPDDPWEIRARQEYRLERRQGRWSITMERDAEILHQEGIN